jgi:hypothetical protein
MSSVGKGKIEAAAESSDCRKPRIWGSGGGAAAWRSGVGRKGEGDPAAGARNPVSLCPDLRCWNRYVRCGSSSPGIVIFFL